MTKVSVIIPTYNRQNMIGDAITSALQQSKFGLDIEVIVVDDDSTDATFLWVSENYSEEPVRIIRNMRTKGAAGARNTGILAANSDYVALLDSDDTYLPEHLHRCAQTFLSHPELGVVFGSARYEKNGQAVDYMKPNFERKLARAPVKYEDEQLLIFDNTYFSHLLIEGCYFNLSTVVLRAEVAQALMCEELRIAEDYEFWVRLSRKHLFACLKQPCICYHLHDQNISFELNHTVADHAPALLRAYEIMLDYSHLAPSDIQIIHKHISEVLFSWAWRCRQHRMLQQSVRLHLQSLRHGLWIKNLLAIFKLAVFALLQVVSLSK